MVIPSPSARICRDVETAVIFSSMSTNETEEPISTGEFARIMEAITSSQARMEAKLVEFKTEVRQGQEDAAARALKQARYEKPYSFKRKGNEEQASFNLKVDESLAEAEAELAETGPSTAPSFNRALQVLQKGRKLIAKHQKLIRSRTALSTVGGWWQSIQRMSWLRIQMTKASG